MYAPHPSIPPPNSVEFWKEDLLCDAKTADHLTQALLFAFFFPVLDPRR